MFKHIKKSTKKAQRNNILTRFLRLEFKSDHNITKSMKFTEKFMKVMKVMKFIVKKTLSNYK